jgi:hypothetical protein
MKDMGIEQPGVIDVMYAERNRSDLVAALRSYHDVSQGQSYWKTYLRQASVMWLDSLKRASEDLGKICEPMLILAGDRDDTMLRHRTTDGKTI